MERKTTTRDRLVAVLSELRDLLNSGDLTASDKAVILQVGPLLTAVLRRGIGRWTPLDPARLPKGVCASAFAPVPGLPKGWALDHEHAKETEQ